MSGIGNILIRPQRISREITPNGVSPLDTMMELASRMIQEVVKEGEAAKKLGDGFANSVETLGNELEGNLDQVGEKVMGWISPFIDELKENVSAGGDGAEGIVKVVQSMTDTIIKLLEGLQTEKLLLFINALFNLIKNDLGLTRSRILQLFSDAVDAVIHSLNEAYLEGDRSQEAKNAFLIGSQLSQLKLAAAKEVGNIFPEIEYEEFTTELLALLQESRWDELIGKILEVFNKLKEAADNFGNALGGAPAEGQGQGNAPMTFVKSRSMRARSVDDKEMSWYASWFFKGFIQDYTLVDNRHKLDEETSLKDDIPIKDLIQFGDSLDASFMENWAHITTGSLDLVEALLHGLSIEKGDYVTNTYNLVLQTFKGLFTLLAHDVSGSGWQKAFKWISIFEFPVSFAGNWLTSLEQYPGTALSWFVSDLLPDQAQSTMYSVWTNELRDFGLSLFTLINADPNDSSKPNAQNYQKAWGFVSLVSEFFIIFGAILPRIRKGKKHFGFADVENWWDSFVNKLLDIFGGIGASYLGAVVGWLIARGISGKRSKDLWRKDSWYTSKIFFWGLVKWAVYYFLIWDGRTHGGTLGQDEDKKVVRFPGYPKPENAPYHLPYEKGKLYQCVQGNHGIWSHNLVETLQTYAIDFNHNEGDEVLAMRSGVVTDFYDIIPNNSTITDNNLSIKHNDVDEGERPKLEHDRDHQGLVSTSGIYVHGMHYGVRYAFALRGIPKDFIVGTPVRQGDLVMYAGDTGISAYNHLHVHVEKTFTNNNRVTLPFVFKEVDQRRIWKIFPSGHEGVPKSFHYYESENERNKSVGESLAKYQPAYHEGAIQGSGIHHVILNRFAHEKEDIYKGAFIYLRYFKDGRTFHEYKKIMAYEASSKKVIIQGDWTYRQNPPKGSGYTIGSIPYDQSNDFQLNFTYLSEKRDIPNVEKPFPDGRSEYVYTGLARFTKSMISGKIGADAAKGSFKIQLDMNGSKNPSDYLGRHIAIYDGNRLSQYKKIAGFAPLNMILNIEEKLEIDIKQNKHRYEIGGKFYENKVKAQIEDHAYLCPDSEKGKYSPDNFYDGREPFQSYTYKILWR